MTRNAMLVAAQSRHQIVRLNGPAQSHRDVDENFVADAMAIHVVDALEAVQVQQQYCMRAVTSRRRGDRNLEFLVELTAIGQSGQRVLHSKFAGALFRGNTPCNLAPLRQQKTPGQRQQSHAEQCRQGKRFVRLNRVILGRHARRIGEDIVFVGDQRSDAHERQHRQSFPHGDAVAPQQGFDAGFERTCIKFYSPARFRADGG